MNTGAQGGGDCREQSSTVAADAHRDKIAALAEAISNMAESDGSAFFDREWEEHKAAVRTRALALLNHRPRSCGELRERLLAADLPTAIVDEVIEDFQRSNLLDDLEFAREWVRQRHSLKGKSRAFLRQELREKHVDSAIIEEALGSIDADDERDVAMRWAVKKARAVKDVPASYEEYQAALRRVVGVLARRGYSSSLALSVGRDALDERIRDLGGEPQFSH